jgi:hypothetical protein
MILFIKLSLKEITNITIMNNTQNELNILLNDFKAFPERDNTERILNFTIAVLDNIANFIRDVEIEPVNYEFQLASRIM